VFESFLIKENIVHIGALLYLAGFLFRDPLILRMLIVAGDIVYILYFFYAPETPLWWGIFWSTLFVTVNLVFIALIYADRTHFNLTAAARALFEQLGTLSPGEFRTLLRVGEFKTAAAALTLAEEGKRPGFLYFVISGTIDIRKQGRHRMTYGKAFVGEVAFLLGRPASATVTVGPGTQYYVWREGALQAALKKKPALATALSAAFNRDLAAKVAASGINAEGILPDA
jgi:hypothetical protein